MSIDLERSLAELARSVPDPALPARMAGWLPGMVTRIRRRRLARQAATGFAVVGVLAGVVLVGAELVGDGTQPVPPATPHQDYYCGGPVTAPEAADGPALAAEVPATADVGDALDIRTTVGADSGLREADEPPALVLARDGVMVAGPAELVAVAESFPPQFQFRLDLSACDTGEPLAPGAYQVVGSQWVTGSDGVRRQIFGGPWPVVVGGQTSADQAVADLIAGAPGAEPFPACGSVVTAEDDPPLAIDLGIYDRVYTPGQEWSTQVSVRTTAGRRVLGNAPADGAVIVLTRDGVVVGRGESPPGDADFLDLGPDDVRELLARAVNSVCGASDLDLPPGDYQAYAVLEVFVMEVQEADGNAYEPSRRVVVISNPMAITIT